MVFAFSNVFAALYYANVYDNVGFYWSYTEFI